MFRCWKILEHGNHLQWMKLKSTNKLQPVLPLYVGCQEVHHFVKTEYRYKRFYQGQLKAAVFDWAGTVVDCGVFSPVLTFIELFEKEKVKITEEESRAPMGLHKRLHIKKLLENSSVRERWKQVHGSDPTDGDIDRMYGQFVPTICKVLHKYSNVIEGASATMKALKQDYGLKIGSTTGFPREVLDLLLEKTKSQGYIPEASVAADEVSESRPGPYMMWLVAMRLNVHPMEAVVKIDDTVDGVKEGLSAGSWTVGVAKTSSYLGMTEEQLKTIDKNILHIKLKYSYDNLFKSGAHYVIDSIQDLPPVIKEINQRLASGEKP